jgi:ABC-type Na+ efflux pump permease subunit
MVPRWYMGLVSVAAVVMGLKGRRSAAYRANPLIGSTNVLLAIVLGAIGIGAMGIRLAAIANDHVNPPTPIMVPTAQTYAPVVTVSPQERTADSGAPVTATTLAP